MGSAVPKAEVAGNLVHHLLLVNHGDDAHQVLAPGTDQWVSVPDLLDEVAPFLGGDLGRGRWEAGRAQGIGGGAAALGPVALAAHFVGVPAVVADHLSAFVGDMLGDGGQEVHGGEDLEVAVDLGVQFGTVDDGVAGRFHGHSFQGKLIHRLFTFCFSAARTGDLVLIRPLHPRR